MITVTSDDGGNAARKRRTRTQCCRKPGLAPGFLASDISPNI
jgi:hypothetical protein